MSKKLIASIAGTGLAVSMLSLSGIFTGATLDLGSTTYTLSEYAPIVALFALAAGAVIGSRDPSTYQGWEFAAVTTAFAVPAAVYMDVSQVVDLLDSYHPYSGLLVVAVAFIGFMALSFRGREGANPLTEDA